MPRLETTGCSGGSASTGSPPGAGGPESGALACGAGLLLGLADCQRVVLAQEHVVIVAIVLQRRVPVKEDLKDLFHILRVGVVQIPVTYDFLTAGIRVEPVDERGDLRHQTARRTH